MTISNRVMLVGDHKNLVFYKTDCHCMNPNCQITIQFEYEEDINSITLTLFQNLVWSSYWESDNLFKSNWRKIKVIFNLIFKGYIEVEGVFMIRNKEHIDALIEALQEGKEKIVKNNQI